MADYRFLTTWLLEAPRTDVFQAIWDSERWPEWWRGVESVRTLEDGDEEGVGSLGRFVWRSRLPYRLEFETRIGRVERPFLLEGRASGELEGTGCWRLFEDHGVTAATYDWRVRTTSPWMNRLAPLMRPVFAWNHDVVMGWGAQGLARLLRVRLLADG
ncbi:MAG TPA: SRPBCC family protein [Thermoleophilaceae bacterium]|nr:SRPBCC family protein [Thermoleophilaceae bacterium]